MSQVEIEQLKVGDRLIHKDGIYSGTVRHICLDKNIPCPSGDTGFPWLIIRTRELSDNLARKVAEVNDMSKCFIAGYEVQCIWHENMGKEFIRVIDEKDGVQ